MDRPISLYTGPLTFSGVAIDRPNKAIVFAWAAETEVSNIILMRFLTLRLRLPPIKVVTAFTDFTEGGEA